jgi:hypothetical protein
MTQQLYSTLYSLNVPVSGNSLATELCSTVKFSQVTTAAVYWQLYAIARTTL